MSNSLHYHSKCITDAAFIINRYTNKNKSVSVSTSTGNMTIRFDGDIVVVVYQNIDSFSVEGFGKVEKCCSVSEVCNTVDKLFAMRAIWEKEDGEQ